MKGIFNLDSINSLDINIWWKSELSKGLVQNTLLNSSFSFTLTPTYNHHIQKKKSQWKYCIPCFSNLAFTPQMCSGNPVMQYEFIQGFSLTSMTLIEILVQSWILPGNFAHKIQSFSCIEEELQIDKYSSNSWYVIGKIF